MENYHARVYIYNTRINLIICICDSIGTIIVYDFHFFFTE